MKYPAFLQNGGSIGFVAPSFGCNIEPYRSAFDHALEIWKQKGFRTIPGPNTYAGEGIGISNTPQLCGRELTEGYLSPESDVLISCGGGELMCEILDYVDFDAVRKAPPKWYMGYSDNTNFTFLLTTLCDTASVYGPCAPSFGMEPWHPSIEDAYRVLTGEKLVQEGYALYETESIKDEDHPLAPYHVTEPRQIHAFLPESMTGTDVSRPEENTAPAPVLHAAGDASWDFSGRLIGGCLDCLVNLAGTGFDQVSAFAERYQDDGIIWFLEACDLNVYAIRRAIWELDHAGWFACAKGFLIGRPLNGQELFGLDHIHAVTDLLAKYQVPILMDLDIGHLPPMMPLVCGSYAHVTGKGQKIRVDLQLR